MICNAMPRKMDQKQRLSGIQDSTNRRRPKGEQGAAKRWKGDLNDFVKDEATEATQSNDLKNNTLWLVPAKNVYEWKKKERHCAKHVAND